MTPEEREEAKRRLAELEGRTAARAVVAEPEPVAAAEPPPERVLHQATWMDRARAGLQGMTLGASDELGALVAAGAVDVMDWSDDGRDFTDIYDEMHQSLQDERETYERDNAGEALALNLVGGVLTGGLGASRSAASTGSRALAKALEKGSKVADTSRDIVQASRAAQAADKASKVARLKKATGISAAEGVVAGAMSADQDERLKGGLVGGTVGTLLPAALAGTGKGINAATRNRRSQQLGKGEDFIPLNMTGGGLGRFYRGLVGKAYGGEGIINEQTRPRLAQARAARDAAEDQLQLTKAGVKDDAARTGRTIDADTVAQKESIDAAAATEKSAIQQGASAEAEGLRQAASREAGDLRAQGRQEARAVQQAVGVNADEALAAGEEGVNKVHQQFFAETLEEMKPASMPAKTRAKIDELEPMAQLEELDNWWSTEGFSTVKDRTFTFDADEAKAFVDDVAGAIDDDIELSAVVGNPREYVEKMLERYRDAETGQIPGRALMEIRNKFARSINPNAQPGGAQLSNAGKGKIKSRVDRIITNELGDDADLYRDELRRYGTVAATRRAAEKAAKRGEVFTPDDYLKGVASGTGRKDLTYGRGARQAEGLEASRAAQELAGAAKRESDTIKDAGRQQAQDIGAEATTAAAAVKDAGRVTAGEVMDTSRAAVGDVGAGQKLAKQKASAARIRQKATVKRQAKSSQRIADAEKKAGATKEQADAIAGMLSHPDGDVPFWEKMMATTLLSIPGFVTGSPLTTAISGGAGAKTLTTETIQRMLAGQASGQKGVQEFGEFLRAYKGGTIEKAYRALERATTREAAASAGD